MPNDGWMSRNKGFSRLTKFLQPPKLVDGIFEVWLRLQKFWWVQKIVRTRNRFALTGFFAKQTKFRVMRTGPYALSSASPRGGPQADVGEHGDFVGVPKTTFLTIRKQQTLNFSYHESWRSQFSQENQRGLKAFRTDILPK